MQISWRKPVELLVPQRLDLVVKLRLFRDGEPALSLYRWHIEQRTGGREPGSWKRSTDDYVRAAADLLASMRGCGFDHAYPVKVNLGGDLTAGAHRVACALALGIEIAVLVKDKPSPGAWGEAWFRDRGCPPETVRGLLDEFARFRYGHAAPV